MLDVLNLALPFFGLIFLGYACGRWKQIPDTGLAWMNFFLIYVALPALFYRILALTPLDEINNPRFIVAATLTTALVFALSALIKQVVLHPFIIATALGVASAAAHFEAPVALDRLMSFLQNAAAPCALFALGVTVALRPIARVPWEVPILVAVKLLLHPLLALVLLSAFGPFERTWVYTAVLMAALPPALNVFIMARQYDSSVREASGAVLLGTFTSVVTLTAVMWLVKTQTLPFDLLR